MKTILAVFCFFGFSAFAHEHGAHVHGAGKINVAFDGVSGKIEFNLPSESLFGFEHKPKNKKQEQTIKDRLAQLESGMPQMMQFDPSLNCAIAKEKMEVDYGDHEGSGEHSDIDADFKVICAKSPLGSKVKLNFFPGWLKSKSFEVQFLIETVQKSFKHQKNGEIVELK